MNLDRIWINLYHLYNLNPVVTSQPLFRSLQIEKEYGCPGFQIQEREYFPVRHEPVAEYLHFFYRQNGLPGYVQSDF